MNTENLGMPTPGDTHIGVRWDAGIDHDANSSDMWHTQPPTHHAPDSVPTAPTEGLSSPWPNVPDWQKRKAELDGAYHRGRAAGYDRGYADGYDAGYDTGSGEF